MRTPHSSDKGYADIVIGMQHGDEGKGRFVDGMAKDYDWVVRYNGGPNAGHTVKANGTEIALNAIPSGVVHPDKKLFIAAHCVVDPVGLCHEIERVEAAKLTVRDRLRISPQASVIQPAHVLVDKRTMKGKVGTTGKGIGPAYAWQAMRVENDRQLDIRMGDLLHNWEWASDMIRRNLEAEMERLGVSGKDLDVDATMQELARCMEQIEGMIEFDPQLLQKEIRNKARILLEGAQAFALDRTYGITPNVTASNTGVAAAFVSTGIPVDFKRKAYGVAKLIPSRVGHGKFVPELGGERSEAHAMRDGGAYHTKQKERELYGDRVEEMLASEDPLEVGIALRMRGGEYGATTARPRRIGMWDEMQVRYAVETNGLDGVYLTKGDCLADFARTRKGMIPVVTGYRIGDKRIDYIPTTDAELKTVDPVVEHFPAFGRDIADAREIADLPPELTDFLRGVRERLGTELMAVGVGPDRTQVVELGGKL